MEKKFFLVGDDEIADFYESLKSRSFSADDFELSESVKQSVGAIAGTVTVTRRSSGATKSYSAGYGSIWLAEFDDDLRLGIFGKP